MASRGRRRDISARLALAKAEEFATREDGAALFRFMRQATNAARRVHVAEVTLGAAVAGKPSGYLLHASSERRRSMIRSQPPAVILGRAIVLVMKSCRKG